MTFLHAVLLGTVEGITEFLPVSSTAHLILASRLLRLEQTEFQKTFDIAIQLGAILAVVVLYARSMARRFDVWLRVLAAFLPTTVLGALSYRFIKGYLMESVPVVLWALLLGGAALILFELFHREKDGAVDDAGSITFGQAVAVGLCQALAFIPGVSRAAATIVGGLLLGVRRKAIVEFSFLLAVPTMAAAAALDLFQTAPSFSGREIGILAAGSAASFLVALLSILWLLRFIQRHSFAPFGIYRILLAVVLWALLIPL